MFIWLRGDLYAWSEVVRSLSSEELMRLVMLAQPQCGLSDATS
jgi:hypothetical protein